MKTFLPLAIILAFVAFGCATPKMTEVPETMTLKVPPFVPPPVVRPEPPKEEELPPSKEVSRFSLSVREADARDVFLLLSKDSGVNIIADKDVTGRISIDFTNLELKSALYAITRQLGFTYKVEKGFIRISRAQMTTRTFYVNYVKDIREAKSTTNIAGFSGTKSGDSASGTGSGVSGSGADSQGINVSLTTQSTSDFWTALEDSLQIIVFGNVDKQNSLKSKSGFSRGDAVRKDMIDAKGQSGAKGRAEVSDADSGASGARTNRAESGIEGEVQIARSRAYEAMTERKLIVNELAGIVQVTDYVENIPNIESFLEDVERAVRKQVMIQAHIVEVKLNDDYKFGIDWNSVLQLGNWDIALSQSLRPASPTGALPIFKIDFNHRRVDGILEAMKGQGQVNVLSSPKISTMNNQRAVIKLTTKEVSWVNTTTFIGTNKDVPITSSVPQIDEVGLFLDVTPQVDNNGTITMQIHPSISEKLETSYSPDQKSTKPIITVKEVDTMIKTKNGQTVVIAGLITDVINDTTKRVPVLGDIPLFGNAFKQVVQGREKRELVILLTPYALTDQSIDDIWKEHEGRLKKAGRIFEANPQLPPTIQ